MCLELSQSQVNHNCDQIRIVKGFSICQILLTKKYIEENQKAFLACSFCQREIDQSIFGFRSLDRIFVPLFSFSYFYYEILFMSLPIHIGILPNHVNSYVIIRVLVNSFCLYCNWFEFWGAICTTSGIRVMLRFNLLVILKMSSTSMKWRIFVVRETFLSSKSG